MLMIDYLIRIQEMSQVFKLYLNVLDLIPIRTYNKLIITKIVPPYSKYYEFKLWKL